YGDIVAPGAFTETLAQHRAKGTAPKFLSEHMPGDFLGDWTDFGEDEKGLWLKGRFDLSSPLAVEKHRHARAGRLDGLSIGFRTIERKYNEETWERTLLKVDLWEVSAVTFPANSDARIDAVKAAAMTERDIEELLTRSAGLSRSVARALMRGGVAELRAKHDAGDGVDAKSIAEAVRTALKTATPCAGADRAMGSRIAEALRSELQPLRS
ncbi:MAG: HK97 family phage prohead protease, partial [Alsobacter sp.]